MNRLWIGIAVVLLLFGGCSSGEQSDGHNNANESTHNQAVNNETQNNASSETDEENVTFSVKDVDIKIYDKQDVRIQGKAKASNNKAYYRILHDKELVEETKIKLEQEGWTSFDIKATLPEHVVKTDKVPVFEVYGKNEDDKEINSNYFGIDFIRQSF